MSITQAAQLVRAQGRGNDTQLMHVTPSEVKALQGIAQAHGGSLTLNPETGLPEAGFLESVLPTIAGIGIGVATGNPMIGAAVAGGLGYGTSGSLEQGLMSGLGAFGGASALGGIGAAGAGAASGAGAAGGAGAGVGAAGAATSIGSGAAGAAGGGGGLLGGYGTTIAAPTVGTLSGSAATGLGPTLQAAQAGQLATAAVPGASTLTGAQQFANMGFMDKLGAVGQGFSDLGFMGSIDAMGAGNLAMAGAPLLGAFGQQDEIDAPEAQESYIRPQVYDPVTQTYTSLDPVQSSDWGTRSFADYRSAQGYQDGGIVQQRYQRPTRTVDPAVTEYNQQLMNQAQQEYVQQQPMTNVPQLTPSLMAPPAAPRPAASSSITPPPSADPSRKYMYNPTTQTFDVNPAFEDPDAKKEGEFGLIDYLTGAAFQSEEERARNPFASMGSSGNAAGGTIKMAQGGIASVPKFQEGGDMQSDAFVVPADVVSALGNGSTDAGMSVLNQYLGMAMPIEGDGDGLSDEIPATIEGDQPARVADGEAYIPTEIVARLGEGDPERGAAKLYVMMDKIREQAHGKKKQQREVAPEQVMPDAEV